MNDFAQLPALSRKVLYIGLHMQHHAAVSGYDQVMNGGTCSQIAADANPGALKSVALRGLRFLADRSESKWYNRQSLSTELTVAGIYGSRSNTLFHFLYGENNFRYACHLKRWPFRKSNRLVATYHTPEPRMRELITNRKHMSALDAVVVMSTVQTPFFADLLGADRVHFVPHGVDVDYFCPRPSLKNTDEILRCITVGHHLRDYDSLAALARRAKENNLNVEFTVVARTDRTKMLNGLPNVRLTTGISDADLLALYQSSDLLMLPVIDATANNTLLEGMACGLPVVSTDIQGIRDYAAPSGTAFAEKGSVDAIYEELVAFASGEKDLSAMGDASRIRALELSWNNVRQQLHAVYDQV